MLECMIQKKHIKTLEKRIKRLIENNYILRHQQHEKI